MSTEDKQAFRPIDRSAHELLIVDDDPASRYATARVLRNAGFRTREAATGADGLAAVDSGISAIVLDVHLPDIDGFELCRRLRSRPDTNRMPVLHLSAAYVTDDDKVRGLDAGADAYLTHPVEPAVLVATVQALVRTHVAEDAMRRSESKFRAIYDQAPSGIALLDAQGRFLDANPAMLALLGRDFGAVSGRALSEFVPPDWTQRVDALTRHATTGHQFPVLGPQGQSTHLEWRLSAHAEPGVTLAVATDISERVALEQQRLQLLERERVARSAAEQVSRMKDDFIAVLSHELRTPLNAISGWTHVLLRRGGSDEAMRGLNAIDRNVRTQARMIADLLDMSRLNMGKLPLSLEIVDLHEAVLSALSDIQPLLDDHRNTVELDVHPPYAPLRADSSRLQQVIWNLLSNAIKFSPKGSPIHIGLLPDANGVTLRVADRGQGIPAEFLPFVFDRFSQSDAASNRRSGGLGLGLSIVKQLVEAHGGTIAASSDGVGQGAVFEVWLPHEAQVHEAGTDENDSSVGELDPLDAAAVPVAGLRMLVVDDDPDASAMLQIILGDRGATVRCAADYDDALTLLDSFAPDLLISDIGMPGRDGYDLIREVRRREAVTGQHLPAIALTSFTRGQDQEQALAAGFDGHCAKPLRPLKLFLQLQRLLDLHNAPQAPR
jgi:PAS domain S-box-containing protein